MTEGLTALHLAAVNNCLETANVLLKNVSTASTLQTKINMQTKTKTRIFLSSTMDAIAKSDVISRNSEKTT